MLICDFCGSQGLGAVGKINTYSTTLSSLGIGTQPLLVNDVDMCNGCLAKFKAKVQGVVNDMKGGFADLARIEAQKKQAEADIAKEAAEKAKVSAEKAKEAAAAPPTPLPSQPPTPTQPAPHQPVPPGHPVPPVPPTPPGQPVRH